MSDDWLRTMEREVRRFERDLPIDDLLPELESGHLEAGGDSHAGAVAAEEIAAAPAEEPAATPAEMIDAVPFSERLPAAGPPAAEPAAPAAEASPEDLDAEVREFMNRDQPASTDEDDFAEFLGGGIDPNLE